VGINFSKDLHMFDKEQFSTWLQEAERDGVDLLVGALVIRGDGRIFAQKRSQARKLFPGCWDIAGGHVESGERIEDALTRELAEETGWTMSKLVGLVGIYEWKKSENGRKSREFEFLVRVNEEHLPPRLEEGKVETFRWFGPDEVDILLENRAPGDDFMKRLFLDAFQKARDAGVKI